MEEATFNQVRQQARSMSCQKPLCPQLAERSSNLRGCNDDPAVDVAERDRSGVRTCAQLSPFVAWRLKRLRIQPQRYQARPAKPPSSDSSNKLWDPVSM